MLGSFLAHQDQAVLQLLSPLHKRLSALTTVAALATTVIQLKLMDILM
jgi:hypothetical protein